jgi:2,3-bisphosphoglycerate-dependent phosphoglycerate mutase
MELVLIRHALPVRRENVDGPADPELSIDGHAQADHLATYLSIERFHAIYASPMVRARQTAEPLASQQGLDIIFEDGVAEYDRNSDSYIPMEELKAAKDPRWLDTMHELTMEQRVEFRMRVLASLAAIAAEHRGKKVGVVCHGGVINAYLTDVLGLEPDTNGFFYPNYTSIHRVMVSSGGVRSILTVNETAHLRGTGLPVGING